MLKKKLVAKRLPMVKLYFEPYKQVVSLKKNSEAALVFNFSFGVNYVN